jgi:hypothetical protein
MCFFYFFYFIYRGEHLNRLGNSLIYCDLSTETLQKPPRLMFFARHNYIFFCSSDSPTKSSSSSIGVACLATSAWHMSPTCCHLAHNERHGAGRMRRAVRRRTVARCQ